MKQDNIITIEMPIICGNTIEYKYVICGDWQDVYRESESFRVEYSIDISSVPVGILLIPLLVNILPISWVCDAEIIVPVCDEDFYNSISEFKYGYKTMFPMIHFGGKMTIKALEKNSYQSVNGTAMFFSGGVDAFCTLIRHREEKPTLITLWGSDISIDDTAGWTIVNNHLVEVSKTFDVDYITVKSGFRRFLAEDVLSEKVKKSGDGWWHGFQHGIGIIGHAAPIMYALGKKKVYIASSFTAADKGKVTCASDPSIDNNVRFSGATVIHDGYELTRQDKIQIITQFAQETGIKVPLRVCWESKGGSNCCHCEKCWRTILGIYATRSNPKEFGFNYSSINELGKEIKHNRAKFGKNKEARYKPIWTAIRNNYSIWTITPGLRWFYLSRFSELEAGTIFERMYQKAKRVARKAKYQIKSILNVM